MRDLLISELQDGHTVVRFVLLMATLIATACLLVDSDAEKRAAR